MKRFYLLSLLSLLIGCGEDPKTETKVLFERFEAEAFTRGREINTSAIEVEFFIPPVTIKIGGKDSGTLYGECVAESRPYRLRLNQNFWETASESEKERLVFHELGHCALGRAHALNDSSLMSAFYHTVEGYEENRSAYLDELFF